MLPLFIVAALLEPTGLFVFLNEYFHYSDQWQLGCMFVFGIMFIQFILTFFALKRLELLFFLLVYGASFTVAFFDWLASDFRLSAAWRFPSHCSF